MFGHAGFNSKGVPPNINVPRNRWIRVHTVRDESVVIRVYVARQRYRDIADAFSGDAFIYKWWSWYVGVAVGRHLFQLWRWREVWAS